MAQLAFIDPNAAELVSVEADATELVIRPEAAADEPIGPATASWYGPGMWGNRTACGHTLTTELVGVAHRTLPCGWMVVLRHGSSTVSVPVVDRGPYVLDREFDLTYATKARLGCPDVCTLEWLR